VDDGASSAASSIDEACDAVFFLAAPGAELSDLEAAKLLTSCATSFYTWPASRPPPFAPVPASPAPHPVAAHLSSSASCGADGPGSGASPPGVDEPYACAAATPSPSAESASSATPSGCFGAAEALAFCTD